MNNKSSDIKEQFNQLKLQAENFCEYKKQSSYKIPFFLLSLFFKWDEETVTECLRGLGSKDSGIDGYHVDEYNREIYLFQFKTRQNYNEAENKDAKDEWFSVLSNFIQRKVNDLNYKPKNDRIKEIILDIRCLMEDGYNIKMFLMHMGFASEELVENYKDIEYIDLTNILTKYKLWLEQDSEKTPDNCCFDIYHPSKENQSGFIMFDLIAKNGHKKKSIVCTLNGNQIIKILEQGSTILDRNVRSFLGETNEVNKGIVETALNSPQQFYFFNNGITITCEKIINNSPSNNNLNVELKNPQIINGAQTVNSINTAKIKLIKQNKSREFITEHLQKINVLCKIVESTKSEDADLAKKMTTYSNKQNKIKLSDFYSNQPEQIQLITLFEKNNIKYIPKRNEQKINLKKELAINMEILAEFHMAQTINPFEAKSTNIFTENCENEIDSNYSKIFYSIKLSDKKNLNSLLKTFFIYKFSLDILSNIKQCIDNYESDINFIPDLEANKILRQYLGIKPNILNVGKDFLEHEKYKYFKIIEIKVINYILREIIENLAFSHNNEGEIEKNNIRDYLEIAINNKDLTIINQIVFNVFKDAYSLYIDIIKKINNNDIKKISRKKDDWNKFKRYVDDYVSDENNDINFKLPIN